MTLRNCLLSTAFALALGATTACGGGHYVAVRYAPPPPRYGAIGYAPTANGQTVLASVLNYNLPRSVNTLLNEGNERMS